jgi:glycosyltransferase involved in cell wall biosynthesis
MNCLNCAAFVEDAIDSVYAQTDRDWEIIFWDNASTDASGEIAQRYNDKLRYFRGDQTVPLGRARNLALQQARGELIAFLDCDDLWLPEKLERQLPLFDDPQIGLVYSNSIYFSDHTGKSRLLYRGSAPLRGNAFPALLSRYFLCLGTVVIRRATLAGAIDWFDPRFNVAEEADLFIRIAHDWQLDYVPSALAKWRIHPQSWTWTKGHLLAHELTLMLEKYEALYENFAIVYGKEITQMRARIAYYEALEDWKRGSTPGARRRIRPYLRTSPRLLVPYVFSFLPFPVYHSLMRSRLRAA